MVAAQRKTPTSTNGGPGDGINYTADVDIEVEALWKCVATELVSVAGTNTITASSDTALVVAITAYARPMAFWLTPAVTSTGAVTINIDGVGAVALTDQDGNALATGALVAGRRGLISFDGTQFRTGPSGGGGTGSATQDNSINGGRLTISTGVPVPSAAVTSATQAYWTPDKSNLISLYNGSSAWTVIPSTEQTIKFTDTQSGNTHSGTKVIDGLTDTSKFMVGMKISGTNVGAGSVIVTIDSSTQITGSVNSTGSATNSITFKVPADTAVDIFGKNNSSSLLLSGIFRATFNTVNALAKQDGIDVLASDHTRRYLGTISTSATDGQIDWVLNGQRRYRVWNRDNKHTLQNVESFSASGTWGWTFGIVGLLSEIWGGGGTGGAFSVSSSIVGTAQSGAPGGYSLKRFAGATLTANQTVTIGSTSSFGANHSATTGATGATFAGSNANGAAPGTGSSGDINVTGAGMPGGSGAVAGTITSQTGAAGGAPLIKVTETIEY